MLVHDIEKATMKAIVCCGAVVLVLVSCTLYGDNARYAEQLDHAQSSHERALIDDVIAQWRVDRTLPIVSSACVQRMHSTRIAYEHGTAFTDACLRGEPRHCTPGTNYTTRYPYGCAAGCFVGFNRSPWLTTYDIVVHDSYAPAVRDSLIVHEAIHDLGGCADLTEYGLGVDWEHADHRRWTPNGVEARVDAALRTE